MLPEDQDAAQAGGEETPSKGKGKPAKKAGGKRAKKPKKSKKRKRGIDLAKVGHKRPNGTARSADPESELSKSAERPYAEPLGHEQPNGTARSADLESEPSKSAEQPHAEPLVTINLRAAVEAVIFAADDPVTPAQVAKAVDEKPAKVRKAIEELQERHDSTASGVALEEVAGGYIFMTREAHAEAIRRLRKTTERRKLSAAALETLAVVAYKQPVQRQEIEDVRGVGCGQMLRTLMEKGLVKIVGRAEVLGRPLLYGTTKRFLDTFGMGSIKDLPKVAELQSGEQHNAGFHHGDTEGTENGP